MDPLAQLTFGLAHLPEGAAVPGVLTMRRDDRSDWLDFSFSVQALARAYPDAGNALWDSGTGHAARNPQVRQVEDWLASLGRYIFTAVPFGLGLIGSESDLDGLDAFVQAEEIPDIRPVGYLWPEEHRVLYSPRTV
ncbi:hypothetical protein GCM10008955_40020 [Deinococcus malanensis]|uniref:DUF3293 domain-containing protein n=1 Tax=Deinococcus malanensis TaxID=1706855 RepID=A0ABQ2F1P3_9DEIO|nr:hypothetical protein [Deinococcus malanensis]GGK42270.1 hypothetical protein GCM10008955_40020 [Deinococcus malanensis]